MARQDKGSKPGFVIKLSNETAQKLAEEELQAKSQLEEQQAKIHLEEALASKSESLDSAKIDKSISSEIKASRQVTNTEVSNLPEPDEKDSSSRNEDTRDESAKTSVADKDASKDDTAWGDYAPYVTYEGEEAIYTDPSNNQKYIWGKESNSWTLKPGQEVLGREYSYEDDTHIYTESDGSKFFWDVEKKAWIPKVDDDFLALYQMSYGFIDNTEDKEKSKAEDKKKEQKKAELATGVKRKAEPQWFQPSEETNTKVYVSNLPQDLTEEEFVNFMQKCGLVERDPANQKMKVKLYKDKEHDCFKGDALCTYIKIESVDLALKLLDGSDLKGNKIKVEKASFQLKGDYNPALKPKKKKKKELEKIKKMQQKLFDWRPEKFIGERSKHERIVIVKNLFHPTDFDLEVQLILDYQQDLREECGKCGEVRKVVIYDRHPEGVAQITMKDPEMADAVVQLINGRWFGKRQITAEIWDGRTKYRIAETDSEISKRINKWDQFLEGKEGEEAKKNGSSDAGENKKESAVTDETVKTKTVEEVDDKSIHKTVEEVDDKSIHITVEEVDDKSSNTTVEEVDDKSSNTTVEEVDDKSSNTTVEEVDDKSSNTTVEEVDDKSSNTTVSEDDGKVEAVNKNNEDVVESSEKTK